MNVPFVVPFYAAIFALIYIGLTIRVIALRNAKRVSLGSGGDPALERAIRIHANFIEYVPLALILLTAMEMQHSSLYVLHILCLLLLIGRICHFLALSRENTVNPLRGAGVALTVLVLVIAAIVLIIDFFRILPTT
ncbi:MAG TPA: MAPEG family protein [Stellaceae bacterium]|jgi:uncharacterized protein|nr:MAPEG family protein [Stellaceae bacterium]